VIAQRFERRHVKNFCLIYQLAAQSLTHQAVDANQKCSQRFSRAGGSRDQRSLASKNVRPTLKLRLCRRSKAANEPVADEWMGPFEALVVGVGIGRHCGA